MKRYFFNFLSIVFEFCVFVVYVIYMFFCICFNMYFFEEVFGDDNDKVFYYLMWIYVCNEFVCGDNFFIFFF